MDILRSWRSLDVVTVTKKPRMTTQNRQSRTQTNYKLDSKRNHIYYVEVKQCPHLECFLYVS